MNLLVNKAVTFVEEMQKQIESESSSRLLRQPRSLVGGKLLPYQLQGIDWMRRLFENGSHGMLADEMGLGKTIQVIGLFAFLREAGVWGPVLIVAPLSTLGNWVSEFQKWCPSIEVLKYHGTREQRKSLRAALEEENDFTEEDLALAAQVDAYIEQIGEVTLESGTVIETARYAFDSLTEQQQTLVNDPKKLFDAEKRYNQLWADSVAAKIAAIGEVSLEKKDVIFEAQNAYDALTDEQKALVSDYGVLEAAVILYKNLVAAKPVIELIDAIGEVTLANSSSILAAIQAYNSLTAEQQELVTNYYVLEAAASQYDSLAAIDRVIRLIAGIGTVSQASGPQIQAAREAYNSLTPDQQREVTNLSVLENAESAWAGLQTPQIDQGGTSGIHGDTTAAQNASGRPPYASATGGGTQASVTGREDGGESGDVKTSADGQNTGAQGEDAAQDGASADETGALPDWLQAEIDGASGTADGTLLSENAPMTDERRTQLVILGIILGSCAVLAGLFGFGLRASAAKRKKKIVHYK